MKEFWSMVQLVFTGIGGWLGYFLGGCDGLILALLLFVVADYTRELCVRFPIRSFLLRSDSRESAERYLSLCW